MRSPIKWFGGKGKMSAKIEGYLPRTIVYVEVFGGGASMMFRRDPSPVEVYNDIDSGLYNFFKVIADPILFRDFHQRVSALPYSRELYNDALATWREEKDTVKKAMSFFVVARQSFGGRFGSGWGSVVESTARKMASTNSQWISTIDRLPEVHTRMRGVQIENSDFRKIIERYDRDKTLFYIDPPYVADTRSSGKYEHEIDNQDHKDLVGMLLGIKGAAVLSGYDNAIYQPLLDGGWYQVDYETVCCAAGRTKASGIQGKGSATEKQARVETLWINPKALEIIDNQKCIWY